MISTNINLTELNASMAKTMVSHLGIEFTDIGPDFISGKMPVDERTIQPFGLLHGGASVALAETLGGAGSACCIDLSRQCCLGLEINANHISAVKAGYIYGTAKVIHLGKKTHIWEVKIVDEEQKLVCISRLTILVVDKM